MVLSIAARLASACLFAVLAAAGPASAQSGEGAARIALVIGNSAYQHAPPLANPKADAELMSQTLKAAGFEVTTVIDGDLQAMKRALLDFGRQLRSRKTEAGLFYYAGHGVHAREDNYLIPVTAKIDDEDEIPLEGVNVNDFLAAMNSSQSAVNIVILDACRNNPFKSGSRSASRGLAAVDAPSGTYIAYATAPGQVALDGDQGNSPYTKALATAIGQPGKSIESVFKAARADVLAATDRKQLPWDSSSITGDFYFHPAGAQVAAPALTPAPPAAPERTARLDPGPANLTRSARPGEVCANGGGRKICVTSVLPGQFGNSYGPGNLADAAPDTAWVEGARGQGVGETISIVWPSARAVDAIWLVNGYAKNDDIFRKNSRVRLMTATTSAGDRFEIALKDSRARQSFAMPSDKAVSWISLEITGVYPGYKYADTAISELDAR